MITAATILLGGLVGVLVLGDAAAAAAIAGFFSVTNTVLTAVLLRWVSRGRRELQNTHTSAAHAALAAQGAAESSLEAARVAKSIGQHIRHDRAIVIHEEPKP